jgi:hypothetical protein
MKSFRRRLRKLEVSLAPGTDAQGRSPAEVLRERRCRRQAQERGVPYEQVVREDRAKSKAFWADYAGDRTIADILRYGRLRQLELSTAAAKAL